MMVTGALLMAAGVVVALDNFWQGSWTQVKASLLLGIVGFALIAAGLI